MFILRTVNPKNNTKSNEILGDTYELVIYTNKELFKKLCDSFWKESKEHYTEDTFGFLILGSKLKPLFKDQWYYVMISNGQTFENISYKD
jgi:hypothetical protein